MALDKAACLMHNCRSRSGGGCARDLTNPSISCIIKSRCTVIWHVHGNEAIIIEGSIPNPDGASGGGRIAFPFLRSQHIRTIASLQLRVIGACA